MLLWLWIRVFGSGVVAVRGLSVVVGGLTVGLLYAVGRDLFDRSTGLVAALLLALSPAHIVYSQETRMYALLALAITGMIWQGYRCGAEDGAEDRCWLWLALWETLAVYTHFFAFLVVISLNFWLLVRMALCVRNGERRQLRLWVGSQLGVLLAFGPWLRTALVRASTHSTMASDTPGVFLFGREVWSFMLGGHLALYDREPSYALAVGVTAISVVLLLLAAFVAERTSRRRVAGYVLFQCTLPLIFLYGVMLIRPGFHPRYALFLLIPVILLVAWAARELWRRIWPYKALTALVTLIWLVTSGLAAQALLQDTYYRRDDAQATVTFLDDELGPGGLVLVDQDGWALRYYMAETKLNAVYLNGAHKPGDLDRYMMDITAGHGQVS